MISEAYDNPDAEILADRESWGRDGFRGLGNAIALGLFLWGGFALALYLTIS